MNPLPDPRAQFVMAVARGMLGGPGQRPFNHSNLIRLIRRALRSMTGAIVFSHPFPASDVDEVAAAIRWAFDGRIVNARTKRRFLRQVRRLLRRH